MLLFHEMQKECLEVVTGNIRTTGAIESAFLVLFRTDIPSSQYSAFSPKLGQSVYVFIGLLIQCVEFPRFQAVKNFTLVSMS